MAKMNTAFTLSQEPNPGTHLLRFRGDAITFTLTLSPPFAGSAWLRTNLGQAACGRREIIHQVEAEESPLGRDWFDLPMERLDECRYRLTVPLLEVGHFAGKCLFIPEGKSTPLWPEGNNTIVNIEPAATCGANSIYNTFVRQFGPNKKSRTTPSEDEKRCIEDLDRHRYTVIPPSGTFRDLIAELDFIIGTLGCRIIQLLPIYPTPTTFARMGRFGSPYAALDFTSVDPALAVFDPKATPLEQFGELVDAIHARQAALFIDIAPNHTGWGARIHATHPEWLVRDEEGRIEVPGAWGVSWADLTRLDYQKRELWIYMAEVFLTWCRRGVDGFRCDAGYMIPAAAWKYIIAKVREQYPDTVFLLEGLGGKISVTEELLDGANFNWAYSELFQNYDRGQIESYLPGALHISTRKGIMVNFAETHDNNRLAATSKTYARMRTALCALAAPNGAFAFTNGVEWLATEKIDVHEASSLNWGAAENLVEHIRRLNAILAVHPTFYGQAELRLIQEGEGNFIVLSRYQPAGNTFLLILVNLDLEQRTNAAWYYPADAAHRPEFIDLLSGRRITVAAKGGHHSLGLGPGQVLCLSADHHDLELVDRALEKPVVPTDLQLNQIARAKALEVFHHYHGLDRLQAFNPDGAATRLLADPEGYCRELNPHSEESRVTTWRWPVDCRRKVMVPPDHFLLVHSPFPFRASIEDGRKTLDSESSLPTATGSHFILFKPLAVPGRHRSLKLKLSVYDPEKTRHADAVLLFLSRLQNVRIKKRFTRADILHTPLLFLGTNGRGAMTRTSILWSRINSRYDALLAANLDDQIPVDRQVMFSRCRAWVVFQGYSQAVNEDCLQSFTFDYHSRGRWHYRIPTGQGENLHLTVSMAMVPGSNKVLLTFHRTDNHDQDRRLSCQEKITLILRPDIEDRNFHQTTKAYLGPENQWPAAVDACDHGFTFQPATDHCLRMTVSDGCFIREPEWQYMVYRPLEAERGLDPNSDLFSPGYFSSSLGGDETVTLTAEVMSGDDSLTEQGAETVRASLPSAKEEKPLSLDQELSLALEHFIVRRGEYQSVIAGYPWFLDWGRDSLIVVRGLIAAGSIEAAENILIQFGRFEEQGTLPNMIQGNNAGNRDTVDAPLWFMVAVNDILKRKNNHEFLEVPAGRRTIREIIFSIGTSLIRGTANGIIMDPSSGLLFSPAHFTWMDTNYPAGTPRQGYPIEIQALWHAALSLLGRLDPQEQQGPWNTLASQVEGSITELFWLKEEGFLADCLHSQETVPAARADADDALRPNQLLAITLGAIKGKDRCRRILAACAELLVPGAIRSLADRPLQKPLAVYHHGQLLNNPERPYQGVYEGDEDHRRKIAYHNGTAWTWLFPSFSEAWALTYGRESHETARSWLAGSSALLNEGCIGQLPEITDGNYPHRQRGCDAQAWGVSELLRVVKLLGDK
jgi:predicted glycogen debranching enzyme